MTAWPAVVDRLLVLLPTLPGWGGVRVYDGPPPSSAVPPVYCAVGWVDTEQAGTYRRSTRNDYRVGEEGTVRARLVAQTGAASLPATRAQVFALVDALDDSLRADQTLGGVLSLDGTCVLSAEVEAAQDSSGAGTSVVLSVDYTTNT